MYSTSLLKPSHGRIGDYLGVYIYNMYTYVFNVRNDETVLLFEYEILHFVYEKKPTSAEGRLLGRII